MSSLMATYAPAPAVFVRGRGSELFDADGTRYVDFVSGIAVTSLGHAHPRVARALCAQAETLVHVSNLYENALAPAVAATLDRLVGGGETGPGGKVFFCNSGAEANECAFKLARRWAGPGRHVVVAALGSFHGRTLATLAATGQLEKHAPFSPMPAGFVHVAYDDVDAVRDALAGGAAAVVVEAIQGEGGVVVPSPGYLAALRSLCSAHDALLICDEVQTGLGRTGRWFAFHAEGIVPDVVTVAKSLGNGMPVGACWARAEVAAAFAPGDHGSTFGGQPLAMAAAGATLEVMEREDVCRRARQTGARLVGALEELPGVVGVRGAGLLLGVVLAGDIASKVAAAAFERGLLVHAVRPEVLRLAPSLLVEDAIVDEAIGLLGASLEAVRP